MQNVKFLNKLIVQIKTNSVSIERDGIKSKIRSTLALINWIHLSIPTLNKTTNLKNYLLKQAVAIYLN